MVKMKKVLTFIYIFMIVAISFGAWLLSFLTRNGKLSLDFNVEDAGLILLGFLAFLCLAFIKDTFYLIPFICFLPFTFARAFEVNTMPLSLYIIIIFAILGMLLHMLLYKSKIKLGKFVSGLIIFVLGAILGGIGNNNSFFNIIAVCGIAIGVLFLYSFIVTYLEKHEFKELCYIMIALGIMLVLQTISYQFIFHPDQMFVVKDCNVGWGCTNNIAIMLLMCVPFSMYLTINSKNPLSFLALVVTIILTAGILLNYSRGAILSAVIIFPVMLIYTFVKSKSKILYILYLLVILALFVFAYLYLKEHKPELITSIIENITRFNSDTLNGRKDIYDRMMEESKSHLWFGIGLLNSFDPATSTYGWGHNVFIHTMYTMGIVGLISICVHLFQKYYLLLKKPSVKKMFVLFAFLASGLYGLMDVGYYFINFMVVLVAILALIEYEIDSTI